MQSKAIGLLLLLGLVMPLGACDLGGGENAEETEEAEDDEDDEGTEDGE
jgi:hypothetical protein